MGTRLETRVIQLRDGRDLAWVELGEASGAALALPLVEAAARMISEMKTFAEAGVATGEPTVTA